MIAKGAVDLITRCAYGLYKDKNIQSFALNPVAYETEMVKYAASVMDMNVNEMAAMANPFPVVGDPTHLGHISASLFDNPFFLESG